MARFGTTATIYGSCCGRNKRTINRDTTVIDDWVSDEFEGSLAHIKTSHSGLPATIVSTNGWQAGEGRKKNLDEFKTWDQRQSSADGREKFCPSLYWLCFLVLFCFLARMDTLVAPSPSLEASAYRIFLSLTASRSSSRKAACKVLEPPQRRGSHPLTDFCPTEWIPRPPLDKGSLTKAPSTSINISSK